MTDSPTLVLVLMVGVLIVTATTLLVALFMLRSSQLQLRYLQEQVEQGRDARSSQNMLYAVELLRDQDFRTALMVVRNRMRHRPIESWDAGDVFHVLLVCSTYNLVGLMVKDGLVPRDLFIQHWGGSVIDSYEALADFVERRQEQTPLYCADYQWLYLECRAATPSEAPSREISLPAPGGGPRRREADRPRG